MIRFGVYLYFSYMYQYVTKTNLNGTLTVDLPFQTLVVDFSLNL